MEDEKLYYSKINDYVWLTPSAAKEIGLEDGWLREVSEEEKKDISFLVSDEYISFFTNPESEYLIPVENTEDNPDYISDCDYPPIMWDFRYDVAKAYQRLVGFRCGQSHIWPAMRYRYFGGRDHIEPSEMVVFLNRFDNKQIVEFLFYCVMYSDRYWTGIYAQYAEEGIIGRLLMRLKQLPLTIEPFDMDEYCKSLKSLDREEKS